VTRDVKRTLALVALNGRAKSLCDDFAADSSPTSQDIAVLMRQIGDQIALAVGLLVKEQAERKAAEVRS